MRLKDALEKQLADVTVKLAMAMPGVFDVYAEGKRIFSKQQAGRYPTVEEIAAAM